MSIRIESWGIVPDSPDLEKRLKSAAEAKLTPVELDVNARTAKFAGSKDWYTTSLSHCSCPDFSIQRNKGKNLPCKHILRLAMECGLIDAEFKSDITKVKRPIEKVNYDPFPSAVAILESSEGAFALMSKAAQCRHAPHDGYKGLRLYEYDSKEGLDILLDNDLLREDGQGGYEFGKNAENCRGKLWTYLNWRHMYSSGTPGELGADGISKLLSDFEAFYNKRMEDRAVWYSWPNLDE